MENQRFFLFLIITLLAVLTYFKLVTPVEDPEGTAEPGVSEAVPELAPTSPSGDISPTSPAAPASPVSVGADLDPVRLDVGNYHIEFSLVGAQPTVWEITDPTYSHVSFEEPGVAQASALRSYPQIIPQPPKTAGLDTRDRPLGLDLPAPFGEAFNALVWRLTESPRTDDVGDVHVTFESPPHRGLVVTKEFSFQAPRRARGGPVEPARHAGGYLTAFRLTLRNVTDEKILLNQEGVGLRLTWGPGIGAYERLGLYNWRSPLALVDGDTWYKSPSFKSVHDSRTREVAATDPAGVQWAGLQSRYFLAALIPAGEHRPVVPRVATEIRAQNVPLDPRTGQIDEAWKRYSPLLTMVLEHGPVVLDPEGERALTYELYAGPMHRPLLLAAGHNLERANYYRSWFWMRGLCFGLTKLLNLFHTLVGNFGWAILMLTVLIRLALYPVTHRQMKIMAKTQQEMARVKPFVDEVREKYKSDPQRMQREMMAVYREHGVNPLAGMKGCLPLLLQMPIFIALFMMLRSSIELRGASWLWIDDLSGPDALFHLPWLEAIPLLGGFLGPSLNLLPVLMAVTQWLTMKLAPTRIDDPAQRTMMTLMPVMLTVFLYRAPSGLMLYWVAGNIWQMGHQYLTTRWVQRHPEERSEPAAAPGPHGAKAKRTAKTRSPAAKALAERRREAARARQRLVSESSSLPRWVRRGGG